MSVSPLLDNWRFLVWFPPAAQKFIFQVIRTGSRAAYHTVKTVWAWSWEFPSNSCLNEDRAMHSLHNTSFIKLLITKPTNNNSAFTRAYTVRFAITDLYAQWMNMRDLQLAFNVATLGTFSLSTEQSLFHPSLNSNDHLCVQLHRSLDFNDHLYANYPQDRLTTQLRCTGR
jgi:hypothetical protein